MSNSSTDQLMRSQELYRAQAIVAWAKKQKDAVDLVDAFRTYMVWPSVAEEVLGKPLPPYKVKEKKVTSEEIVLAWAEKNTGKMTSPREIAEELDLSYSACNTVVQTRLDWFSKVKRGQYLIKNPDAERAADKESA